jgi:chromosome segregation ATPase
MEKLNQAVTEVSQLLMDQHLEISSLSEQKKKLEETVGRLEEELRQCRAEMMTRTPPKNKKFFRWWL